MGKKKKDVYKNTYITLPKGDLSGVIQMGPV